MLPWKKGLSLISRLNWKLLVQLPEEVSQQVCSVNQDVGTGVSPQGDGVCEVGVCTLKLQTEIPH